MKEIEAAVEKLDQIEIQIRQIERQVRYMKNDLADVWNLIIRLQDGKQN